MEPAFYAFDGVGVASRGNALLVVYVEDARVHRSRWIFDHADELAEEYREIYALMIVDTAKGLPDGTTRAENARRLRALDTRLKVLVTVPTGDALRVILVKAMLRTMAIVLGEVTRHQIADTVEEGVAKLRRAMGRDAPSAQELMGDLARLWSLAKETPRTLQAGAAASR